MKSSASAPRVLFEDNHLLILSKPQGWMAQRDAQSQLSDLETWAERYRQEKESKEGVGFIRACHRLDTPVTGIVCMAKTSKAQQRLQESQQKGLWYKFYLAITAPCPRHPQLLLQNWLIQGDGRAVLVAPDKQGAKEAKLRYEVIDTQGIEALVGIELLTGRYHQIRAQMAAINAPILGDRKYGSQKASMNMGIALHHSALAFPHPITQQIVWFREMPEWANPKASRWIEEKKQEIISLQERGSGEQ